MPFSIQRYLPFSPNTFSLIIAPQASFGEALTVLVACKGHILYLCGNYPEILPGLAHHSERFRVRRALTAYQILSILEESSEPLTIFEHDRSLYDDAPDLIRLIGERCRQRASENGSVVLIATRPDTWLEQLQKSADRIVYVIIRKNETRTKKRVHSEQLALDFFLQV
jgi:hypothetical protein